MRDRFRLGWRKIVAFQTRNLMHRCTRITFRREGRRANLLISRSSA
jgi:ATP sulfurylase